jgi:hypothetical protein
VIVEETDVVVVELTVHVDFELVGGGVAGGTTQSRVPSRESATRMPFTAS